MQQYHLCWLVGFVNSIDKVAEIPVFENVFLGDQVIFHYFNDPTYLANNFVYIHLLVTKPEPLESQQKELSNGIRFNTKRSIWTKLLEKPAGVL